MVRIGPEKSRIGNVGSIRREIGRKLVDSWQQKSRREVTSKEGCAFIATILLNKPAMILNKVTIRGCSIYQRIVNYLTGE